MSAQDPAGREPSMTSDEARANATWGMNYTQEERVDVVGEARAAYAANHAFFQADMPVAWVQGWIGVGQTSTRTIHPERYDILGAIEAEGWHLEHVSTSFVEQGSSATKRVFANQGSTVVANHGMLVGLYVFRRR